MSPTASIHFTLIEGLRAGGNEEPVLVLGTASEQEMAALCYEVGTDAYLCVNTTTTRTLLWTAAPRFRGTSWCTKTDACCRPIDSDCIKSIWKRIGCSPNSGALVSDLESLTGQAGGNGQHDPRRQARRDGCSRARFALPENLVAHYRRAVQGGVIMGSGNLTADMQELSELLVGTGVTPQQTMLLHLQVLEKLSVSQAGEPRRSACDDAHDLLVLEIMIHLAEGYRDQFLERVRPPGATLVAGCGGWH